MAQPSYIIDQSVRHFMYLWNCGFKLSLSFETLPNGVIVANSTVQSFPMLPQDSATFGCNRNRSGRNARFRRQKTRTAAKPKASISTSQDQVISNEEATATLETLKTSSVPSIEDTHCEDDTFESGSSTPQS